MDPRFMGLVTDVALAALERQLALGDAVGERSWSMRLEDGVLRFGRDMSFPAEVLGTEDSESRTWLPAWANPSVPRDRRGCSRRLRALGGERAIPELVETPVQLDGSVSGHAFGMLAVGLGVSHAYYWGPHEGGAAVLVLDTPALVREPDITRTLTVITTGLELALPDHRRLIRSYLGPKGYEFGSMGLRMVARSPSGPLLRMRFDAAGRLADIDADL